MSSAAARRRPLRLVSGAAAPAYDETIDPLLRHLAGMMPAATDANPFAEREPPVMLPWASGLNDGARWREYLSKRKASVEAARATRRDRIDRRDTARIDAVNAYRRKNPGCSRRDIARHLVAPQKRRDIAAVRAMAETIKRLEKRALKKK